MTLDKAQKYAEALACEVGVDAAWNFMDEYRKMKKVRLSVL